MDSWPMMSSPWPALTITGSYLYFVLIFGPWYMKYRQAYNLKYTIIFYNLGQVVYNVSMLIVVLSSFYLDDDIIIQKKKLHQAAWCFMFIKFIDLLDTVFFVLRKKQSHITVLHVYHHTCMAVGTWAFVKYTEGQQCVLIGVINSAVHAVMYGYYLLSALGPQVQKYLWWKKYITKLQMGQFIVIMGYLLRMLLYDNNLPKIVIIGLFTNTGVFLALFYDFYCKSYFKPTKQVVKFSN
ncbi:unnamed protein product [Bemisia tabaci]|uniref:Elongation of very long chain fatty acids protein n=1 Tax=Bemisia tabaci TaxID=7038 RepID=A0A9P0F6T9_BEMTA|nr:unnamed protein product [Bemisia tabaci]